MKWRIIDSTSLIIHMSNINEMFRQFKAEHKAQSFRKLNDRVLLVDGLNLFIRAFSINTTLNDSGEHVGGIVGFLMGLGYAIRIVNPTRCIIVFDGVGGSKRRRELYPEYKNNRKSMTRLARGHSYSTIDDEKHSLKDQLVRLVEILEYMPTSVLSIDHIEADDAIAYLTDVITENGGGSVIMSTDKDYLQLSSDSVEIFNPVHKRIYNQQSITEKYEIHPNNFVLYRSMDGDDSDNINGVKGIGIKTLLKYFPEFSQPDKVLLEQLYAKCEENKGSAKIFEKILNDKDIIDRNLQLMKLSDVDISGNNKMKIIDLYNSKTNALDKFGLTKFLIRDRLLTSFKDFNGWLSSTFGTLSRFTSEGEKF